MCVYNVVRQAQVKWACLQPKYTINITYISCSLCQIYKMKFMHLSETYAYGVQIHDCNRDVGL